jgi:hypothetical protein
MKAKILPVLIALPVCLAMVSFKASAEGVEGAKTTANIIVQSAASWTTLSNSVVDIPAGQTWHCIATGSADGSNPAPANSFDHQYRFTLSLDSANPVVDGACERMLEFDNNFGVDDVSFEDVNSTCPFKNIGSGTHVFRWQARKVNANDLNLTVLDNSHTVMCSKNLQ